MHCIAPLSVMQAKIAPLRHAVTARHRHTQPQRSARSCAQQQIHEQEDSTAGAIESLLVPWLAFQNQSELAAEALVEACIGLFRSGWTVERVQLEMTFLTLKSTREEIKQVQALDSEMLLSFICLIMITCKETECPLFPGVSAPEVTKSESKEDGDQSPPSSRMSGLKQYARQTLQQYTNGATLRSMMKKQNKAVSSAMQNTASTPASPGSAPQAMSPNMLFMQNLTRIVLLTIETLQQQDLVPPRPVLIQSLRSKFGMAEVPQSSGKSAPSARLEPTQFAQHLDPEYAGKLTPSALLSGAALSHTQIRWLAVRMLLAFMGAAMGWAYSWHMFVNTALLAYMAGVSAEDLMSQVSQQEFSQAGTMFKAAASASIQSEKINAEAFARWLSTAYMTWALLGITHPAGEGDSGWAWVPTQLDSSQDNTVVAHAMSEFVAQTLRRLQQEDAGSIPPEQKRTLGNATMKGDTAVDAVWLNRRLAELKSEAMNEQVSKGFVTAKIEDPDLARSSSAMTYMLQQTAMVRMCRDAVLTPAPSV
eukprot:jgi/Ulvmu1/7073/UM033_0134.1